MNDTPKTSQRRRYPSLNLQQAIERVEVIYAAERMNPAPIEVITEHWGFMNHRTGPASTTYSAVKQFGLLEEQGSPGQRKARVSGRARAILTAPEDVRQSEIRAAALEPPMNRLIWERYGADPGSNSSFRWMLVDELGFSDTGAREFAKQYQATLEFAQFDTSPPASEEDLEGAEGTAVAAAETITMEPVGIGPAAPTATPTTASRTSRHAIPLIGGKQVVLEGEFPLTEAAWDGFMAVLQAFKPGLVAPESQNVFDSMFAPRALQRSPQASDES